MDFHCLIERQRFKHFLTHFFYFLCILISRQMRTILQPMINHLSIIYLPTLSSAPFYFFFFLFLLTSLSSLVSFVVFIVDEYVFVFYCFFFFVCCFCFVLCFVLIFFFWEGGGGGGCLFFFFNINSSHWTVHKSLISFTIFSAAFIIQMIQ